uniref:Uncharacterized protein n=1 Tax=Cannabis sativa TaxID=3483 RepID=A0A803QKA9_CANSA
MPHVRKTCRKPKEYDRHMTQFICAKLIVQKSKDLDKARGGKVIITELLIVSIESGNPRDRAFKVRPLVFSSNTQHKVELIWDEYSLPEIIIRKSRIGCPSSSRNPNCSVWSRFHMNIGAFLPLHP